MENATGVAHGKCIGRAGPDPEETIDYSARLDLPFRPVVVDDGPAEPHSEDVG